MVLHLLSMMSVLSMVCIYDVTGSMNDSMMLYDNVKSQRLALCSMVSPDSDDLFPCLRR